MRAAFTIDVVIPVYNAPEFSRQCIDSVVVHLGSSIRTVYVQNDASELETRIMLDGLRYPQVKVFHAKNNQGYGKSVNDAVARSDADWVLVLNSDVQVLKNFLPLLCAAIAVDPGLVVISPIEGDISDAKTDCYLRQPGGYIITYRFRGYAFLIRRVVFQAMGGFDSQFGRGYYEDTDLGHRLVKQGWRMGIHPGAVIRHETGASFGRGKLYQELMCRNRALYLSRYPLARQNVLVVSGADTLNDLPLALVDSLEQVMREGGRLHLLTPARLPVLSCLQMRNSEISLSVVVKLMFRGCWSREDKRITAVWLFPAAPVWVRILLKLFVLLRNLEVREWNVVLL